MQDLEFILKPSNYYLIFWLVIFILNTMIIFLLPFGIYINAFGFLLMTIYCIPIVNRYALLRSKDSIIRLRPLSERVWLVQTKSEIYEATLCGSSTVTTIISILRFKLQNQYWPVSCLVLRDSLAHDQYRRLLICARM